MNKTVFSRMLDADVRQAFLERKASSYNVSEEEYEALSAYIPTEDCARDIRRLANGDYYFKPPRKTYLRKKNSNRRRAIYRFSLRENMLLQLMAFVLHDYDGMYEDAVYSFRLGRHISGVFRELRRRKLSQTRWVLKTDIKSYGDNVDAEILVSQLDALFGEWDPEICSFLRFLLCRNTYYEDGVLKKGPTGALSGCSLTNFFENVYLMDVDRLIVSKSDYYCRYADDIAVFLPTEAQARELYDELQAAFSRLGLSFNVQKTQITPPGGSFELLGFRIEGDSFDIAESSLEKVEWKLKHTADKLVRRIRRRELGREEAMALMVRRIDRYFFGRQREENELNWVDWSFKVLTRCDSLKRLDFVAQECIRYVGSGGKRSDAKYRVRYAGMRHMGYRTLVHAFYHGVTESQIID